MKSNMNLVKTKWFKKDYKEFLTYLKSLKDNKYAAFNARIIKTKYTILGIKFPVLRSIAKEIGKGNYQSFLDNATDTYFEEVFIYGLVSLKDANYFYPYLDKIDNWALCDSYCSSQKFLLKSPNKYINKYFKLLKSSNPYYIRVGLVTLLNFYVNKYDNLEIVRKLLKVKNDDYYVLMGMAWLLQVIAIEDPVLVIGFCEEYQNPKLVSMLKTKIRDSYKIKENNKTFLIERLGMI